MNTIQAVTERRSVKSYDAAHVMPQAELDALLDAARLSPTSFNIQHWRFVVVRDKDMRAKIREAAWGQAQVTDSSVLLVLCADVQAWQKNPKRYFRLADENVQNTMAGMIDQFYRGRDQVQRDEAMRSVGIAAQTIMLTAKSMGYDTCPMIGFDPDAVAKLINLPSDHVIGMMIAVGKKAADARPRAGAIETSEAVIYDRFAA
jgi:nitroreductase